MKLSRFRAFLAACLLVAPLGVSGLLLDRWILWLILPVVAVLVAALTWAYRRGALGTLVIGTETIEVRRWGHLAESYAFADMANLGLGQGASQQFVGIKLWQPLSERTHWLPDWERECMLGWPNWDAVLPLEVVVSPKELLQKCVARRNAFVELQQSEHRA